MSISAKDFFKQNWHKAGEGYFAPVIKARKVEPGDKMEISLGGGLYGSVRAQENGWLIEGDFGSEFLIEGEFSELSESFKPVTIEPSQELPEGAEVTAVKKGERIFTQPFSDTDAGVVSEAELDGYLVTLPADGKQRFVTQSEFAASFKNGAQPDTSSAEQFLRYEPEAGAPVTQYVVLDSPQIFAFKAGNVKAPAGSVLYKNEDDEDGYTLLSPEQFAYQFRVTKEAPGSSVDHDPAGP